MYVRGNEGWVAHIGDSRIYHVREGQVVFRTIDHTRVQKMVEMGLLSAVQAKDHPDANVVTRALGYSQLADGTVVSDAPTGGSEAAGAAGEAPAPVLQV